MFGSMCVIIYLILFHTYKLKVSCLRYFFYKVNFSKELSFLQDTDVSKPHITERIIENEDSAGHYCKRAHLDLLFEKKPIKH